MASFHPSFSPMSAKIGTYLCLLFGVAQVDWAGSGVVSLDLEMPIELDPSVRGVYFR
jgi:hypothetical protein